MKNSQKKKAWVSTTDPSPVPSRMEIWDIDKNELVREHDIRNVKSSGDFIQRTLTWALTQGYGVQFSAETETPVGT